MPEKETRTKADGIGVPKFSRRQFLQRLGITTGGAFVATLSLVSACKRAEPTTGTTSNTGTNTAPTFSYTVPAAPPPLVPVPGLSNCTVATDRLYTNYHVWVKLVSTGVVVLGITSPMVKILGEPHAMTLPDVGLKLAKDDSFSSIEGYKMATDIFTPVSGAIVQINDSLRDWLRGGNIQPIEYHPYTHGWIIAIQLSKPDELKDLLDSKGYLALLSKST
ncbi:MAG: glycine cleavage system protein H [Dehalococcoidia bacterium]|nr:MAG: glycine cleavage system protein H [Dehalococcoidia bacterium]